MILFTCQFSSRNQVNSSKNCITKTADMDSKNVLRFFGHKLGSTDLLSSSPISSNLIFLEFSLSSKSRKLRCLLEIDNTPTGNSYPLSPYHPCYQTKNATSTKACFCRSDKCNNWASSTSSSMGKNDKYALVSSTSLIVFLMAMKLKAHA